MKEKISNNFLIMVVSLGMALAIAVIIAKLGYLSLAILPLLIIAVILGFYIIRTPELGWLLIVFFLPFERVPSVNFGGVDIKINTILGFLTFFAWLIALIGNPKKYKVEPNALAIPLSLFVIALLLSLTQAVDLTRAVSVLVFIIFTILLSVLAVNLVNSREMLRKILLVLFASALVVGLFGLFQFGGDVVGLPRTLTLLKEGYTTGVFGFPRIQAFSMEPLYLANYLLIPIAIGLALILNRVEIIKRGWLVILIGLLLLNFILTVSRGGYLGLVVTLVILGLFFLRRIFTWKNVLTALVVGAVVIYGVAFALSKGEYRATNEFLGHVLLQDISQGESVQGRLLTFDKALHAYRQNPLLGIGIGNYGPWVKSYPDARPITGWDIVNNEYLELMAETGLVGLIAFAIVIIVLTIRTFVAFKYAHEPILKAVLVGALAALGGILVQYNFMSTLYIIHVWVLIGLLVAVQNIILRSRKANF